MNGFDSYLKQNFDVARQIDPSRIQGIVSLLVGLSERGATLWVAGNGGSAATASHFVADMIKTARSLSGISVRSIALHESISLTTAYSNDVSFEASLGETLRDLSKPGDALLVLSVSGISPNLVYARAVASELGLVRIGIVGAKGLSSAKDYDECIVIDSIDYQVVENLHVFLMHWFAKSLTEKATWADLGTSNK